MTDERCAARRFAASVAAVAALDEDTAIWVRPDATFEVMGLGGVMVLDAKGARVRRPRRDAGPQALGVHDLRLHLLLPGETYDLRTRTPGGTP